jgi:hypothetical protein
MIDELVQAIVSWRTFIIVLIVFGFAPGAVLRLIVLLFPRDDPRRRELLAELYAVPWPERPLWVAQQMEVAFFEGLPKRIRSVAVVLRRFIANIVDEFVDCLAFQIVRSVGMASMIGMASVIDLF